MAKQNITRRAVLGGAVGTAVVPYVAPVLTPLNILSATLRPAMRGIFSDGRDQRAALLDLVKEAVEGGKTIEWGAIDVSLDVVTKVRGQRGLVVPSGSHWVMHPDTRIRALPNNSSHYEIISIANCENVLIEGNGARIIGERNLHTGTAGEWGLGVSIRGGRKIRISDLTAEDCWGDGFYIGRGRRRYCQDVLLKNTRAVRARRNGLSLISARGFLCEGHESIDTSGRAPQWGIDIEPNNPDEYLDDITFVHSSTINSTGVGLGIYLAAFEGSPNPISIRLIDCVDVGSTIGFSVASARDADGRIDLVRPRSERAGTSGISLRRKAVSGPRVSMWEPQVIDWNRDKVTVKSAQAAISIFAPTGDGGTEPLGGVDIINPDIRLTNNDADVSAAIFTMDQRDTNPSMPVNVRIVDPLSLAGLRVWLAAGQATFKDRHRVSRRVLPDADATIGAARTFVHNVIDVTETRSYTLAETQPVGVELSFEIASDEGAARIILAKGDRLKPEGQGFLSSAERGATLRIRKSGSNRWLVVEKTGTWTTG